MAGASKPIQWYIGRAGKVIGPVEEIELAGLARDGHLQSSDFIWNATMPEWVLAGSVSGLIPAGVGGTEPKADLNPGPRSSLGTQGPSPASEQPFVTGASPFLSRRLERSARERLGQG